MWNAITRAKDELFKRREARADLAVVEKSARRVLQDCIALADDSATKKKEYELDPDLDLPVVVGRIVDAKKAAVRLVTLVGARARRGGLSVGRGVGRADHSITLSQDAVIFCTVSARDGQLFVDAPGPAQSAPLELQFNATTELFEPTDPEAWPDPVAFVAAAIARCAPTPSAAAMILGFTAV